MTSPTLQNRGKGKIVICSFQNRVCPRFDLTHEMLIFDGEYPFKGLIETINVPEIAPEKLLDILAERKVDVLISGGVQKRFQEMFSRNNINVIWGVAGEIGDVIEAYRKGMLYSGIGEVRIPRSDR